MRLAFLGFVLVMISLMGISGAQLTEISASSVHMHVGRSALIKVYVHNPDGIIGNITGWLGGDYPSGLVKFLPDPGITFASDMRNFTVTLNPKQEKALTLAVSSTDPKPGGYTITLGSNTTASSLTDSKYVKVLLDYTPTFPGLDMWSTALLIAGSGAFFYLRNRK